MTKIVPLQRLNPAGIETLWDHITGRREDKAAKKPIRPLPDELSTNPQFVDPMGIGVEIDVEMKFDSRLDFAKYICGQFGSRWNTDFLDDPGLWAWLSVVYWDQFTAAGVSRHEHYVPLVGPYAHRLGHERLDYRSCTRTPVLLFKRFGDDARFFLSGSAREPSTMATMGDLIEQLLSRQDVYGNDHILKTIITHYSDADGRVKSGTTGIPSRKRLKSGKRSRTGYGKLRRLIEGVLPRLKLTYNVEELSPAQIMALAGPEFIDS